MPSVVSELGRFMVAGLQITGLQRVGCGSLKPGWL